MRKLRLLTRLSRRARSSPRASVRFYWYHENPPYGPDAYFTNEKTLILNNQLDAARNLYLQKRSPNANTAISLITHYCGQYKTSRYVAQIYEKLVADAPDPPDAVVFKVIMQAYRATSKPHEVGNVWSEILRHRIPLTEASLGSMTAACEEAGDANTAKRILEWMFNHPERYSTTKIQCGQMIKALCCGDEKNLDDAMRALKYMDDLKVGTNSRVYIPLIDKCGELSAKTAAHKIHRHLIANGIQLQEDDFLLCGLIWMYSQCGSIVDVERLLVIADKTRIESLSWRAALNAYTQHGLANKAIALFEDMIKDGTSQPDGTSLLDLITVCGDNGLVELAEKYYKDIESKYNMKPSLQHSVALAKAYGRAGRLQEAEDLVISCRTNPKKFLPAFAVRALMFACFFHNDVQRADRVWKQFSPGFDPTHHIDISIPILYSKILAKSGRFKELEAAWQRVREIKLTVAPGASCIEIGGAVHRLFTGDDRHERIKDVHKELEVLKQEMIEKGYKPYSMSGGEGIEMKEDLERDTHIFHHSEKLALGLGLISTPKGSPLLITSSARICTGCHESMKVVSKLRSRKIVVRSVKVFHTFVDGKCSCGDYW